MMSSTEVNIKSMLNTLPHKLQVEFAVYCCNDIKHLITDKASIKALQLVEQWLKDGTLVTTQELIDALGAFTFTSVASPATAIYTCTYTTAAAITSDPVATAVYYAVHAATYAAEASAEAPGDKAVKLKQYETYLINSIANLSILEKLIYNINIENKER